MNTNTVIIRHLGKKDYASTWQEMQDFTHIRDEATADEIWSLEHEPIFTQGQNGKEEHLLHPGDIPIVHVDRGGQVTYHGPGQIMLYTLIDLRRKKLNVRELVTVLEKSAIDMLAELKITAVARPDAPGVYIDHKKICSVGLRIRRGCSYHGLALNWQMDLEPFSRINPCGFADLKVTQLSEWVSGTNKHDISTKLINYLATHLGYTNQLMQE